MDNGNSQPRVSPEPKKLTESLIPSVLDSGMAKKLAAMCVVVSSAVGCAAEYDSGSNSNSTVQADAGQGKSSDSGINKNPSIDATKSEIPWGKVVWAIDGKVSWDDQKQELTMLPNPATEASALVISNESFKQPFRLSFTMKTNEQLFKKDEWNVGWAVIGYKEDGKFKYVTVKTNGLEIGESLLNDAQKWPYTEPYNPGEYPIGVAYEQVIEVANDVITVTINGKKAVEYKMFGPGTVDTLTADGKVGFYTEDANVTVSNIKFEQL